jgi:hypothetical protein
MWVISCAWSIWALVLTADCSVHLIWTHWFWLLIFEFEMGRAHSGCDRPTGDAYSFYAPDPTSGLSRGLCFPNLPDLYFIWVYETDHRSLYYPFTSMVLQIVSSKPLTEALKYIHRKLEYFNYIFIEKLTTQWNWVCPSRITPMQTTIFSEGIWWGRIHTTAKYFWEHNVLPALHNSFLQNVVWEPNADVCLFPTGDNGAMQVCLCENTFTILV